MPKANKSGKVKTSLYLTPEMYEDLGHAAVGFPGRVNGLVEKAIQGFLELGNAEEKSSRAIDSPGGTVHNLERNPQSNALEDASGEEIQWLEKLLDILRSGNQDAISAVTQNIKFFQWSVHNAIDPTAKALAGHTSPDARHAQPEYPAPSKDLQRKAGGSRRSRG